MFLNSVNIENQDNIKNIKDLIKNDTQLHTRENIQEAGVSKEILASMLIGLKNTLFGPALHSDSEVPERITFSCFSTRKVARCTLEDFRNDISNKGAWHTLTLMSRVKERILFFSLVKKFWITGLTINELLLLDDMISHKWLKMTVEEQIISTFILKVAFAAASGAKSFSSTSKPLRRLISSKKLLEIVDIQIGRFIILILETTFDLTSIEKSKRLTWDIKITKGKKHPPVAYIGKSNSMDGSKSSGERALDLEIRPEQDDPDKFSNVDSDMWNFLCKINKYFPSFIK